MSTTALKPVVRTLDSWNLKQLRPAQRAMVSAGVHPFGRISRRLLWNNAARAQQSTIMVSLDASTGVYSRAYD